MFIDGKLRGTTIDGEVWEIPASGTEPGFRNLLSDRVLIDTRLYLALQAVAFALCMTDPAIVWSFLAAAGTLMLSIAVRPTLRSRFDRLGAFEPAELGLMLWTSEARAMLDERRTMATSGAVGMIGASTVIVVIAGATQNVEMVLLAAIANLVSLAAVRQMFRTLVEPQAAA